MRWQGMQHFSLVYKSSPNFSTPALQLHSSYIATLKTTDSPNYPKMDCDRDDERSGSPRAFRHRPLRCAEEEFRLVNIMPCATSEDIECEIRHLHRSDISSFGSYTALSYAWGKPAETHRVHVTSSSQKRQRCELLVAHNLWQTMAHIVTKTRSKSQEIR